MHTRCEQHVIVLWCSEQPGTVRSVWGQHLAQGSLSHTTGTPEIHNFWSQGQLPNQKHTWSTVRRLRPGALLIGWSEKPAATQALCWHPCMQITESCHRFCFGLDLNGADAHYMAVISQLMLFFIYIPPVKLLCQVRHSAEDFDQAVRDPRDSCHGHHWHRW